MSGTADDLASFLKGELSHWYPGACCRLADRWVMCRLGYSPLKRFGRDFETDRDVTVWLGEPGGIAVAVNRVMRKCGLQNTKVPEVGDVGLVLLNNGLLGMAIKAPTGWVSRDDNGMISVSDNRLWKAWRIEYARCF